MVLEINFWDRVPELTEVRNEAIRQIMGVKKSILETIGDKKTAVVHKKKT